jgi:hypothetical protein
LLLERVFDVVLRFSHGQATYIKAGIQAERKSGPKQSEKQGTKETRRTIHNNKAEEC